MRFGRSSPPFPPWAVALPETVLVTGGSGFVGRAVTGRLGAEAGFSVRQGSRRSAGPGSVVTPNLGPDADWGPALAGANAVVHLAARVHIMRESSADPLAEFRHVNSAGTESLARQAASAGVRRFVYLSSIKVNGEETTARAYRETDSPNPVDPYGISKLEAEQAIARVARETGMEFVVIRPPLVYGPGVRANFRSMMSLIRRGVPLPFGAIDNRRSLVAVDNLADLIAVALRHPAAADQVFLAGDGEDLSTTDLFRRLAAAMGRPARLLPVPSRALGLGLVALGQDKVARRLCGSLQIDISKARQVLGWQPVVSVDEGLRRTAAAYVAGSDRR